MLTINTEDFMGYGFAEFYKHLVLKDENEYEIFISKYETENFDNSYCNYRSYMLAAYSGQLLFNIAEAFSYYVPCKRSYNSYRFEIKTNDKGSLAEILAEIVNVIYDCKDDVKATKYQQAGDRKFFEYDDGNIDLATTGLFEIASYFADKILLEEKLRQGRSEN